MTEDTTKTMPTALSPQAVDVMKNIFLEGGKAMLVFLGELDKAEENTGEQLIEKFKARFKV